MAQPARSFQLVVAADQQNGIGKDDGLPWPQGTLPRDMKYFKDLTSTTRSSSCRNAVIMGRRTWESIPDKFRPLPGRLNIILSRQAPPSEDGENSSILSNTPAALAPSAAAGKKQQPLYATSLDAAMQLLEAEPCSSSIETVFVIGGGQVYAEALASPRCSAVHLTKVESTFDCDTFFPNLDTDPAWKVWSSSEPHRDNNIRYSFLCYVRSNTSSSSGGAKAGAEAAQQQQQQQQQAEERPPQLPPAVATRHEEYQVCGERGGGGGSREGPRAASSTATHGTTNFASRVVLAGGSVLPAAGLAAAHPTADCSRGAAGLNMQPCP
jgi:dihydrofolate reductase/thymidylate synthase